MRKAITLSLSIAIAASGLGLMPAWASGTTVLPDNKNCSKHEYERIGEGMTKAEVKRITRGRGIANYGGEDFTGYLYGGMPYGNLTNAAGCNIVFNRAEHHPTVIRKDGWFPQA